MTLFDITWTEIGEILLRVLIVYLIVLAGMRLLGKREIAQLSVIDFVLVLLIANAVQNAMVGEDTSVIGGIVAAAALFGINFVMRWVILRNKRINRLLEGEPVMLIYKGKIQTKNLRRVQITDDELMAVVREHGVAGPEDVDLAMLEVNGSISILSNNFSNQTRKTTTRTNNE